MANLTDVSLLNSTGNGESALELEVIKDIKYSLEENRRQTFTTWPFSDTSKCTADAMAEAGFIHLPTAESPDAVTCFFCCKELDGWEPEDDPWEEHVSHARGKCSFLKRAKVYETDITRKEFVDLEIQRQKNIIKAKYELMKQRAKDQSQQVRAHMLNLV